MIWSCLGVDSFSFKYFSFASDTTVLVRLLSWERGLLSILVLSTRSPVLFVANCAVYVIVWTLDCAIVPQLCFAFDARKTLLVIEAPFSCHFLSLEHFSIASSTCFSIPGIPRYNRGVPGDHVLSRPVQLVTTNVAVQVIIRTNCHDVDTDWSRAVLACHAFFCGKVFPLFPFAQ